MAKDKSDKKKAKGGKPDPGPPPRLRDKYFQEVAPKLMDQFGFSSLMRPTLPVGVAGGVGTYGPAGSSNSRSRTRAAVQANCSAPCPRPVVGS